ncbi:hypothetical protein D3C77_542840 [compost metagenome]
MQGLFAIGHDYGAATQRFELLLEDGLVDRIVFGHEDVQLQALATLCGCFPSLLGSTLAGQRDGLRYRAHAIHINFPVAIKVFGGIASTADTVDPWPAPGKFRGACKHFDQHRLWVVRRLLGDNQGCSDTQAIEPVAISLPQFW